MRYCLNPTCQKPQNLDERDRCQNCHSKLLLENLYYAIKPIGAGGMGRTFLAQEKNSEKRVVIKQFFPQNFGTENSHKAAQLFRQEANRLEELGHHPQIPQLLDSFQQEGQQYLVQEYIEGQNLAQELAEKGPFSERKINQLLKDILPVLEFIHSHNVIHRDIKPENIIRRVSPTSSNLGQGQLVLVDFGAAKFTSNTTLGKTGTIIGSAAYTAPEQVRGKAIFSSDLYSLAVTCIHLLTQVPPFDLFDSSEDVWVWRSFLKNKVRDRLGNILDKMLQSGTKKRYKSAREILDELNPKPTPIPKITSKKITNKWLIVGVFMGSFLLVSYAQEYFYLISSPPKPIQQPVVIKPTNQPSLTIAQPPDFGCLYGTNPDGILQLFPLKHTEVTAKIAGNVSRVEVVQTFQNPYDTPLEAVYKFPLPDESAVDDMEIRIGERIIKGQIKKRQDAKQIYQQAKQQGKTAALLDQERDNVFTQSIANIKPGETIEVLIRYTDSLKFAGGNYQFVFPMVVGPRYSSGKSTEAIGDDNGVNSSVNSPLIPPNIRSGQDIGVTVEIDAGVPISQLRSPSHNIQFKQIQSADNRAITQVQLSPEDTIPNKDLVLNYRVSGTETQSTVLTNTDNKGGHFGIYLIPAISYKSNQIVPKDVIFLMDTSGSQSGAPLEQSKALMRRFINGLNPADTFTIIDFANTAQALSSQPLPNTPENRSKALNYISNLQANGGTELLNGIETVLDFPAAPDGRLRSIVLLTDGLIDEENQVIASVQKQLKPGNRLYSFGVGSSVNRFLLNRLSEEGRGTAHFVRHDEPIAEVTEKFFQEMNNPVLTNIKVEWDGLGKPPEIYPLKAPDLFAKQPLVLFGRKQDRLSGNLRISGIVAGGQRYEKTFALQFREFAGNPAIAQLWGRSKIKQLTTQMAGKETPQGVAAVTDIALAYRLMSAYTSFVAVSDELRVNPNTNSQRVQVPINTPDGMDMSNSQTPIKNPPRAPVPVRTPNGIKTSNTPISSSSPSSSSSSENTEQAPEPSVYFSMILFVIFFGWKRWLRWKKGVNFTSPK